MRTWKSASVATVLSVALLVSARPALAQEESDAPQSQCKRVKARQVDFFDPATNASTGPVTGAGLLNGTQLSAFTPGALPTADPAVVTFTADYTLTTDHGVLKAANVYLYDVPTNVATTLSRINPATSIGRFAGATGTIYYVSRVISLVPFVVESDLTADICLAR
jgi:hypothetical protein